MVEGNQKECHIASSGKIREWLAWLNLSGDLDELPSRFRVGEQYIDLAIFREGEYLTVLRIQQAATKARDKEVQAICQWLSTMEIGKLFFEDFVDALLAWNLVRKVEKEILRPRILASYLTVRVEPEERRPSVVAALFLLANRGVGLKINKNEIP